MIIVEDLVQLKTHFSLKGATMKCLTCGRESREGALFCGVCGAPQGESSAPSARVSSVEPAYEFSTKAQRTCYEKVAGYGRELFGELFRPGEKPPTFYLRFGSAKVGVSVTAWGDDDAVIDVWSWVVTKVEVTDDLMEYLLRENYDRRFGALSLDKDNDIHYCHKIAGASCNKNELKASMMAVATAADEYDDVIKARWGGKRWFDSAMQPRPHHA